MVTLLLANCRRFAAESGTTLPLLASSAGFATGTDEACPALLTS
jgi:hypothetical protein